MSKVMEIEFENEGDHHLMKMTGILNGQEESSQIPVVIKEDGIYATQTLDGEPMKMFWVMGDGHLTSMAGDFKR